MKVADLFALLSIKTDKASLKKAENQVKGFAGVAKRAIASIGKFAKSRLGIAAIGAAFAVATRDALRFTESLGRLGITSGGALGNIDELQAKILKVSDATGIAKEQVLAGVQRFIELTGDSKAAAGSMGLFAKVSQASGATMRDVAGSAAALSEQLGISSEEMERGFSILIKGGKAGAAELKDTAAVMARLSALSSQFSGGQGLRGLASISSALQIVTGAVGGKAAEGATALEALMDALVQSSAKLKKEGIKVFKIKDGKKVRRELFEIVQDIKAAGLDPEEIVEIFGRKEARRALEALTKTEGAWADLANETLNANDVAEDYAKINKNAAIKVAKAWNKFKNFITRVFAVVVDGIALAIENVDLLVIAIGLLSGALLILKARSIATGLAMAASWLLGMAPLILVGLLILGLILILEDLWTVFSGGEGIFSDAKDWLLDVFFQAILWWEKQFQAFFDWLADKFAVVADKANLVLSGLGLVDRDFDILKGGQLAGSLAPGGLAAGFGDDTPVLSGAQRRAADAGISNSLTVNVEAGATVDEAAIQSIDQMNRAALERVAREAATEGA